MSWARMSTAPADRAAAAAARLPASRSAGFSTPVTAPMNRFRDTPTRTGEPRATISAKPVQEFQVVRRRLAEADARVQHDALAGHAGGLGAGPPFDQEPPDLAQEIVVARGVLHGSRSAAHVHEDESDVGRRGQTGHGRIAEGGDVVDDRGARLDRFARHRGLGGVDGDRHAETRGLADDRQDPAKLLLDTDRVGAGTGAFAADVEKVRAVADERFGVTDRRRGIQESAAVGEGVGGHVDDAHDPRPAEIDTAAPETPGRRCHRQVHACPRLRRTGMRIRGR